MKTVLDRFLLLPLVGLLLGDPSLAGADAQSQTFGSSALSVQSECSLHGQLETLRLGLLRGSPALKKFLRKQLRERAATLPEAELRAAFLREREPAMIEELSGALAARMARHNEPSAVKSVLDRAMQDRDPAARAAAVRGLRGTASVEAMEKLGGVDYRTLVKDPAPEVRQAVASNLLAESAEVYFGHDRAVSEQAIAAALAVRAGPQADPALAAKLLSEISTESVGSEAVSELVALLDAPSEPSLAALRAAVVLALGGVPSTESARVIRRLIDLYRQDDSREVRRAVLTSLCRLQMATAIATLEALRPIDASLSKDIDAWQQALRSGLQEWTLQKREKQRILPDSPQPP